ncbi:hypothetical protein [Butyrivibrio sp. LC3010]|uniref:hypothetical protein n=1 Tax=Butyrivibrio sp. LC3010 TaxID=1280680 RepID=UPI0004789350|nr:hypothetical protein [Butyrivibrio sp. LC3010]
MLIIYGAGKQGLRILYILEDYGVKVDGFLDRDKRKVGETIDSVTCFSLECEKVKNEKELKIIISPKKNSGIYRFLKTIFPKSKILYWEDIKGDYPLKISKEVDLNKIRTTYFDIRKKMYEDTRNKQ